MKHYNKVPYDLYIIIVIVEENFLFHCPADQERSLEQYSEVLANQMWVNFSNDSNHSVLSLKPGIFSLSSSLRSAIIS